MSLLSFAVLQCEDPGFIANGNRRGSLQCNQRVEFSCNAGFTLQGSATRTCRQDGLPETLGRLLVVELA